MDGRAARASAEESARRYTGVRVDPVKRVVTVLESDATPMVLPPGDTLEGGPVLPGLGLAAGELFRGDQSGEM